MTLEDSNSTTDNPIIVGLDDGHDHIKVYAGKDPITGKAHQFKMFSRAAVGAVNMGDEDAINKELVVVDGRVFTVNESLPKFENTRFDEYPTSPLSRALVYQALRNANLPSTNLKITSGLPVDRFYHGPNRTMNKVLLDEKNKNLMNMGGVFNKYDEAHKVPKINIVGHKVLCEANAAYYDVLLDDDGDLTDIALEMGIYDGGAAVIDIGGRTTDCVVVNPGGMTLNSSRSGTLDVGVLQLQDNVRHELKQTYGWGFINEKALSLALITNIYTIGSRETDVSNIVISAKKHLFSQIENFIESTIGDGSDLPAIILVGGGSYVLQDMIKARYGNVLIPEDSEYSNARGFYKIYKNLLGGE